MRNTGPLPRPNHPFEGTLWVVGPGERAGVAGIRRMPNAHRKAEKLDPIGAHR